jgi:hypothetical protein
MSLRNERRLGSSARAACMGAGASSAAAGASLHGLTPSEDEDDEDEDEDEYEYGPYGSLGGEGLYSLDEGLGGDYAAYGQPSHAKKARPATPGQKMAVEQVAANAAMPHPARDPALMLLGTVSLPFQVLGACPHVFS